MCSLSNSGWVRTSMMSVWTPRSSRLFSSSTPIYETGYSGWPAGGAAPSNVTTARAGMKARRTSASHHARPAAHGGATVAEPLGLHGLALAAVGDGVELKVRAHRVHVHEVVTAVGDDASVPVALAQLSVPDLEHGTRRDAEVLPALGDGGDPVPADIPAAVDLAHDLARI